MHSKEKLNVVLLHAQAWHPTYPEQECPRCSPSWLQGFRAATHNCGSSPCLARPLKLSTVALLIRILVGSGVNIRVLFGGTLLYQLLAHKTTNAGLDNRDLAHPPLATNAATIVTPSKSHSTPAPSLENLPPTVEWSGPWCKHTQEYQKLPTHNPPSSAM